MRVLRWLAACVVLVLLIIGVGSVMTFVFGGATPVALIIGAVLVVMSWHGLRRIEPRGSDERPPDHDWGTAILVTVIMGAIVIGGLVWTPWVTVFGVIVFWRWVRLVHR